MSNESEILNLVRSYGPYLPVMIVLIVGIIIALSRWKRHPSISLLALLGLSGQLILFLINMAVNLYAPRLFSDTWTSSQMSTFFTVKYIITSVLEAILWVLVLLAIFNHRGEQKSLAESNAGRSATPVSP